MIKVTISQEQKEQLFKEQFTHPHPRVVKKMWALYLKSFDLHNDLICNILQIDWNTFRTYFKDFNAGGSEKLKIELLFLPSYSPNLNLIERLWKFIKKDCL